MNSNNKTTRTFMVINQKGEHDYNITVSEQDTYGRTYELRTSNGPQWSESAKDKLLLTMKDTGNGIEFDRQIKFAEYDFATYMRLLLTFDNKVFSSSEEKFKIIEQAAIIEL